MRQRRAAPSLDLIILDELSRLGPQSLDQLRSAVRASDRLLPEDKVQHKTRPNEAKWESDLSNRLQPSRAGSLSQKGYTRNVSRGQFEITSAGQVYRKREHEENAAFLKMLGELNIDMIE